MARDEQHRPAAVTPGRAATVIVLAAILLLTLNLRPAVTGVSPLLARVSADVGLSATQIGLLGSLPPFCFAAAGLIVPPLLRKAAGERLVVAALALVAVGQLTRPFAPHAVVFLALTTVALLGMGSGNVLLPPIVKAWFPHRIGTVTAAYVTGVTFGTALPPLLAVPVADAVQRATGSSTTGWRVAIGWWGLFAVLVALVWLLPGRRPRALPVTREVGAPPRRGVPVWRSRTAWGIALCFAGNAISTYALFAWLPLRLTDAGLSQGSAGVALAVLGAMGMPCALVVPPLAARMHNHFWLALAFTAFFATGELGLLLAPTTATLLWASLCGLGGGAFPLALTLVGLRSRTPHTAGSLSGFVQGTAYLLGGLGPVTIGVLHERIGGWTAPLTFLLATLTMMLVGGWLVRRPVTVDDEIAAHLH